MTRGMSRPGESSRKRSHVTQPGLFTANIHTLLNFLLCLFGHSFSLERNYPALLLLLQKLDGYKNPTTKHK